MFEWVFQRPTQSYLGEIELNLLHRLMTGHIQYLKSDVLEQATDIVSIFI